MGFWFSDCRTELDTWTHRAWGLGTSCDLVGISTRCTCGRIELAGFHVPPILTPPKP